ncbi:unnamed protein product [Pylaiella littoralis]
MALARSDSRSYDGFSLASERLRRKCCGGCLLSLTFCLVTFFSE